VAPGVARYCYWKYARRFKLAFGSYIIESTEGTHQGDPMSPMLFALGMRTVPSCTIMDILEEFDDMSRHTFSEIFTFAPVDVITWHEISLPTHKGGLSLCTTTDHASAAYLASIDGCHQMVSQLCPNYTPVALSESVHDYNNRTSAMHLSAERFPYVNTPLVQK